MKNKSNNKLFFTLCGILQTRNSIKYILRYLHNARTAIYFENEEYVDVHGSHANDTSEEHIILDPQWLVNAFKCLITADQFVDVSSPWFSKWCNFKKTHQMEPALLEAIWKDKGFIDHKDLLLSYMNRLGLIAHSRQGQKNDKVCCINGLVFCIFFNFKAGSSF